MSTHRPTPSVTALALLVTAGLAGDAVHAGDTAPPGLTLFQPGILPTGLSPDGRFATFSTIDPLAGYRWSVDDGVVMLPPVPGSTCTSAGLHPTSDGDLYRAFYNASCPPGIWRWPPDGPPEIVPGTETPPFEDLFVIQLDTSSDGQTLVGYAGGDWPLSRAWRWTAGTGYEELQDLPGGLQHARALAISADGSVVVGYGTQAPEADGDSGTRPVAWIDGSTTPTLLGVIDPISPWNFQRATLVSADGSIIAGNSGEHAFRWTSETGIQEISEFIAVASMSPDGQWIFGYQAGSMDAWREIWSEETGLVPVRPWLESRGFHLPDEWFDEVNTISFVMSEGMRVIFGGVSSPGQLGQPFMYVLPETCPGDLDGSGTVDFADVTILLADWGQAGGDADLDGSGLVDLVDLVSLLAAWGPCA